MPQDMGYHSLEDLWTYLDTHRQRSPHIAAEQSDEGC